MYTKWYCERHSKKNHRSMHNRTIIANILLFTLIINNIMSNRVGVYGSPQTMIQCVLDQVCWSIYYFLPCYHLCAFKIIYQGSPLLSLLLMFPIGMMFSNVSILIIWPKNSVFLFKNKQETLLAIHSLLSLMSQCQHAILYRFFFKF